MSKPLPLPVIPLLACAIGLAAPGAARAIPSPLAHLHDADTVDWSRPGAPALPWTDAVADANNHQHLTDEPLSNGSEFIITKVWDNRTLHHSADAPNAFGHGMILPGSHVRYGWGGSIVAAAKDVVEAAFGDWITRATQQFDNLKEPWDRLALGFDRVNAGTQGTNFEVLIDFGAIADYGVFDPNNLTLTFLASPDPTFDFADLNEIFNLGIADPTGWKLRLNNAGGFVNVLGYTAPWSYDGTPAVVAMNQDIDFEDPMGNILEMVGGLDMVDFYEMDFATVAKHEVGHVIALGHPANDPKDNIMRALVRRQALFGMTLGIDADSARGVAVAYAYAVPEPSGLALAGLGLALLGLGRRRLGRAA